MAIALRPPNTIMISDPRTYIRTGSDDGSLTSGFAMGTAATPGMLVELANSSGANVWQPNSSATEIAEKSILLDKPEEVDNTGIEDEVAIGENAEVAEIFVGAVWNGIVLSGQTVRNATLLAPDGTGKFIAAGTTTEAAGIAWVRSLQDLGSGAVGADTRCLMKRIS